MKTIYCFCDAKDVRSLKGLKPEELRALLGGKGAGLLEMSRLGLVVPPGFTVTTQVCRAYYQRREARKMTRFSMRHPARSAQALPRQVLKDFIAAMAALEKAAGRKFGDEANPLLVSVRSGAKFSMPGMMDTILDLGLNDRTIQGLEAQTRNPRFAWDCYRRFIAMFGNVVKGIDKDHFETALRSIKTRGRVKEDSELSTQSLKKLVDISKEIYIEQAGFPFPQNPWDQLRMAVTAVFESWNNPRAIAYRKQSRIPDSLGTACTVQAMVFGNMGGDCATGVGFTRDPGTGERRFYGEYLVNAQGEDVVAGARTPKPLAQMKSELPRVHCRLESIAKKLERHYKDIQDMEFTVEKGRLYMLQTRTGKRSALAALRIAVDMVEEGLISEEAAVERLSCGQLDELLRPVFDSQARAKHRILAKGLAAGPGAASGRIAFSAAEAEASARSGPVILVRPETNPDDIHGMIAAQGILTMTGGLTSHAAVVGRGLGKVCVVGCETLRIHEAEKSLRMNGSVLRSGDFISLDGFTGDVIEGQVETQPSQILRILLGELAEDGSELFKAFKRFMGWVDKARDLAVWANGDTPQDAKTALALGAAGIGLCRTEHMFFKEDRIAKMFAMIVAETDEERYEALEALFPLQKQDFLAIFRQMKGLPVTIRTLDPPLHEFLPRTLEEAEKLCRKLGFNVKKIWAKTLELKESNPMLGHRGCRLGITYPEITEMQARAILSAACEAAKEGVAVSPEIMIPLVGHAAELRHQRERVEAAAQEALSRYKMKIPYRIGTMIEVPRAAVTAHEIAREADFFSFGTNDMTQMTLGFSRDDYGRYMRKYQELKVLPEDPFQSLDQAGVGELVRWAIEKGRREKPNLKIGICGEHGGDPASIAFFDEVGVDYVSCSPYRVPVARLAAAQAALRRRRRK
ncbi:MAG: pyruvate, phosphate dikinase [Elusimicrobia bacterium]|nr:pyruvate, phosphate dikinase [Elusimicrobiota bacterium]